MRKQLFLTSLLISTLPSTLIAWFALSGHDSAWAEQLSTPFVIFMIFAVGFVISLLTTWLLQKSLNNANYTSWDKVEKAQAIEETEQEQRKNQTVEMDQINPELFLDALAGGLIGSNKLGRVLYLNHSAEKMINLKREQAMHKALDSIMAVEDIQGNPIVDNILALYRRGNTSPMQLGQVHLKIADGTSRYIDLSTTLISEGKEDLVAFVFRDETAARKIINRLYKQASFDTLTGLMNRRSFMDYLEQSAHDSHVKHTNVLVTVDLDKFKIVNDTCGHLAGDELLKMLASIFKKTVRQTDKVGRLGGDEFAFLLEDCSAENAQNIMNKMLVELRNTRFTWDDQVFPVGASIGLVAFQPNSELKLKTLISEADEACYKAKKSGRNQVIVSEGQRLLQAEGEETAQSQHTDWSQLLLSALKDNRFIIFAQAITPLKNSAEATQQYEILLRLPFRKQMLTPGGFLPAADRLNLMSKIDRWVIEKTFALAQSDDDLNNIIPPVRKRLMVNLSAHSVQDPDFYNFIIQCASHYEINPSTFCFEIAEPVMINHFLQTKLLMKALSEAGFLLCIDDFGAGLSSMNYIRDLPISFLKIDGNFVHNITNNQVDVALIKAIHDISSTLNMRTIAEQVEDEATLNCLRNIGIDFAQGYYCGLPASIQQVCKMAE